MNLCNLSLLLKCCYIQMKDQLKHIITIIYRTNNEKLKSLSLGNFEAKYKN